MKLGNRSIWVILPEIIKTYHSFKKDIKGKDENETPLP
jgi:hypothetical protein